MSEGKKERREFKAIVSEDELQKIRKAKVDVGVESNKDLILKLIDYFYRTKGREVL